MNKSLIILAVTNILSLLANTSLAQTCDNVNLANSVSSSRFKLKDQLVLDKTTHLTWQRCSLGQTGESCDGVATIFTWQEALIEAEKQSKGGWRLPNLKELSSLVALNCREPATNLDVFPNTQSGLYWSSSPDTYNANFAMGINFFIGSDAQNAKYKTGNVRLVRYTQKP